MKYLIIPDVHNQVEWAETLIAKFPDRKVVFLGDYFDSFGDTPEAARRTAEWLRHSLEKGRVHLMGNHDLPYRWQNTWHPKCPGWTREKARAILDHVRVEQWQQMPLVFILDGKDARPIVTSHAGITLANLYGVSNSVDCATGGRCAHLKDRLVPEHLDAIRKQAVICERSAKGGGDHFWLNQGSRMGEIEQGGPFWLDRWDFNPIAGINQVVGHTRVDSPHRTYTPDSDNWFIDGHCKFAALIDNFVITPIHAQGEQIGQVVVK